MSVVATLILGIAAFSVAYLQLMTAESTFEEKLFDRRMSVYMSLKKIIGFVARNTVSPTHPIRRMRGEQKAPNEAELRIQEEGAKILESFHLALEQAKFIFGKNVQDYLHSVDAKIREYARTQVSFDTKAHDADPSDVEKVLVKETELYDWICKQLTEADTVFEPEMAISRKRISSAVNRKILSRLGWRE